VAHNAKPGENPLLLPTRRAKRLRSLLALVARGATPYAERPGVSSRS
jgi:hypothetical protein